MELKKINVGYGRTKLGIDNAKICFKNFDGSKEGYALGFSVIIPNEEIKDLLINDVNEHGASWNVKIAPPREEGDTPFMHLPVKFKIRDRSPQIYVVSNGKTMQMAPVDIHRLQKMSIASVDLDISPSDGVLHGRAYRSAYLDAIWVYMNVGRLEARFAEQEYPEE